MLDQPESRRWYQSYVIVRRMFKVLYSLFVDCVGNVVVVYETKGKGKGKVSSIELVVFFRTTILKQYQIKPKYYGPARIIELI